MNSRAIFLFGVMLVSPAWSQEAATVATASSRSFDLSNESVKKIVRDTVATQAVAVQPPVETPVARKPPGTVVFVPAVKAEPVKYPTRLPDPAPQTDGFLSALIETLLGIEDDTAQLRPNDWLDCRASDNLKATVALRNVSGSKAQCELIEDPPL
jgi:hypothetical protein